MTNRNIIMSLIFIASTVVGTFFVTQTPALAADTQPYLRLAQTRDDEIERRDREIDRRSSDTSCGGVDTALIDCEGEGADAIFEIVKIVIRIMTAAIGVVAVGAVIYGAILYGSSADSPEQLKKAKSIWINVVIGLFLFAFLVAFTSFLIPGGVF